jgi:hypothetical protein
MAKPIVVSIAGQEYSFDSVLVDRAKLYGVRKRLPIDSKGNPCMRASLTLDGATLLLSGMTAQGYFNTNGIPISRSEMVGLDAYGNKVEQIPSTLGASQALQGPVSPSEVLELEVESIFCLDPLDSNGDLLALLKSGAVYKFPFNYTAGLEMETAYLVANDEAVFAIVGKPAVEDWIEAAAVYVPLESDDTDTDDLDFEAL